MAVELEVVAAAILDDGLMLACRRAPGKAAAGRWEFPGGKVDAGEDPKAALERELLEELEIQVEVGDLLDRTQTKVGDVIIDLATYEVTLLGRRPNQSTDHDQLGWFALDELASLDWATPDLPAVAALVARSNP
jgi:8-oxo-dGTP diphosphatase